MLHVYDLFHTDKYHITLSNQVVICILCHAIEISTLASGTVNIIFRDQVGDITCMIKWADVVNVEYFNRESGFTYIQSIYVDIKLRVRLGRG